jgi:hypothetical protein
VAAPPPPTTSSKTRREPTPCIPHSRKPLEPRRWVGVNVDQFAALRTPQMEAKAGSARKMTRPAPMGDPGASRGGRRGRRGRKRSGELARVASGVRGTRGGCGGRRAHLPLVSAAIAGHMTEAVAGMTVRALATRVGGRPREGGRGCRGAGKGRREDSIQFPFSGDNHRFL